jgi:hypothetical protein
MKNKRYLNFYTRKIHCPVITQPPAPPDQRILTDGSADARLGTTSEQGFVRRYVYVSTWKSFLFIRYFDLFFSYIIPVNQEPVQHIFFQTPTSDERSCC